MILAAIEEKYAEIRDSVREFCTKTLSRYAQFHDEHKTIHKDVLAGLKDSCLLGIPVPEQYEGLGLDTTAFCVAIEEIARVCPSTALTLAAHTTLATMPIVKFGNDKQKSEFVPPLARGDYLGSFCLTEPDTGSDISSLRTTAVRKGGVYFISGTKMYVTNASFAGSYVLAALTDPSADKKHRLSFFALKSDLKGISILKTEDKLGMRGSATCLVSFDNVEIFAENILGREGDGFEIIMDTLNAGRIGIASLACGIAIGAYNIAKKYSAERKQFGKYLNEQQAIQMKLADMRTQIEAARLLTYNAASMKDAGRDYIQRASMAKLYSSQVAMDVTRNAIQILGGYGYMSEYEVERFYRDAKLCEIGEGTSEIQKLIIFKQAVKETI